MQPATFPASAVGAASVWTAPDALSSKQPLTVLLVDDQPSQRQAHAHLLAGQGHRVVEADGADAALAAFARARPDLVLLDVEMPGHDGYWLARRLRESEPGGWTPIIFLSARDQDLDVMRGIEAGGDDYLVKPVSPVVLEAKLRAMQRLLAMRRRLIETSDELRLANSRLQELCDLDPLTGLANRRGFDARLHCEIASARRDRTPLTLVLCDVDHFKAYNDSLGHLQGDACLRQLAELLRQACRRPRDVACRYGGEEFALVLPNTPRSGAMTFARAVQRLLASQALAHPASAIGPHLTISGGITTCVPDLHTTPEHLLMRADEALYAAKRKGRNRFFSFEMQIDTREQQAA